MALSGSRERKKNNHALLLGPPGRRIEWKTRRRLARTEKK